MISVTLLTIHGSKLVLALVVALCLLLSEKLLTRKFDPAQRHQSRVTIGIWRHSFCSLPSVNFKITDQNVTKYLGLPDGTALSPKLAELSKCRVAMDRFGLDNAECFCVGFWSFLFFGLAQIGCCLSAFVDFVDILSGRKQQLSQFSTDSALKTTMIISTGTILVVLLQIEYWLNTMRYTLPGYVYDRPYFEIPEQWLLALVLVSVYLFPFCVVELFYKQRLFLKQITDGVDLFRSPIPDQLVADKTSKEQKVTNPGYNNDGLEHKFPSVKRSTESEENVKEIQVCLFSNNTEESANVLNR